MKSMTLTRSELTVYNGQNCSPVCKSVILCTYEDYGGKEGLSVLVDAPLAVQGYGQDGEDHHLHGVSHPAQSHHLKTKKIINNFKKIVL